MNIGLGGQEAGVHSWLLLSFIYPWEPQFLIYKTRKFRLQTCYLFVILTQYNQF